MASAGSISLSVLLVLALGAAGYLWLKLEQAGRNVQQLDKQLLRQQAEIGQLHSRIKVLQQHDDLTRLPNRQSYFRQLEQALHRAQRHRLKLAVVVLDLVNLKHQLQHLGQQQCDEELRQLAIRLQGLIRETDTLARLGSDEFGFVFEDLSKGEDSLIVCRRIIDLLPEELGGCIGLSVAPDQGTQSEALLIAARQAAEQAKHASTRMVMSEPGSEQTEPSSDEQLSVS